MEYISNVDDPMDNFVLSKNGRKLKKKNKCKKASVWKKCMLTCEKCLVCPGNKVDNGFGSCVCPGNKQDIGCEICVCPDGKVEFGNDDICVCPGKEIFRYLIVIK